MKRCVPVLTVLLCLLPRCAGPDPARVDHRHRYAISRPARLPSIEAGCVYGRCELGSFQNLEGAVNDAQSIADVLTGPKFGFPADNVVLLDQPRSEADAARDDGASRRSDHARRHSGRHEEVPG